MPSDNFGDEFWIDEMEEAARIVHDLALIDETEAARMLPELIQRARSWRRKHTSVVE